ncbi:hypothetical protein [Gelidibacter sp.]|uniref:hypothetical protein n=1 Tax=Gelidibacter sp. TaxID=2018083 RepID=UPI002BA3A93A|nr:hypothetical protein [Gelidibacter sp.]HUH27843.1 hypothetical protein [Gelidibacter sp.]
MDGSLSHFKATLQRRKERKDKNTGKFGKTPFQSNYNSVSLYIFPKVSVMEMEVLKKNIGKNIKRQQHKETVIRSGIFIVLCSSVWILIHTYLL